MASNLLQTKLYVPRVRPDWVPRPRLIERLDEGLRLGRRLTLLSAPAGFGKTTLLSAWAAGVDRPVAWLSLDPGDNELPRFLAYLVAALQSVPPLLGAGVGQSVMAAFQSTGLDGAPPPPPETTLTELINELASASDAGDASASPLLVLDDFHVIGSQPIHQAVRFLVENLPEPLHGPHLVLAGRADPPWPLARLRARGEITEVRAADLRFTSDEAAAFLSSAAAVTLSPVQAELLHDRTEGWIAGLQMAALSLQGRQDTAGTFIHSFRGTHRYVLDYLVEEVMQQQPPAIEAFLIESSILDRLTGPLCDAVLQAPSGQGQEMLAGLEAANLFLLPLDDMRRWYRYHHLFADLLRSILPLKRSPDEIRQLHSRASGWYQDEGLMEEALKHAIAANDFERAADMIEDNIASMLSRSESPTLLAWLEKLPPDVPRVRPWINLYHAWTLVLTGRPEQVDGLLDAVESGVQPSEARAAELLGSIAAVRVGAANLRGDVQQVIELGHVAQQRLPKDNHQARAMIAYTLADAYFVQDDMESASLALQEMMLAGEETGRILMSVPAICDLGAPRKAQGRLHQAKILYDRGLALMQARKAMHSRVRCPYEAGMADLHYEWNDLQSASEHASLAVEYGQRFGAYSYVVLGYVTLIRLRQAQGDIQGAVEALASAEAGLQDHRVRHMAIQELATARVALWIAAGDLAAAVRAAEACDGGSDREQMALARLLLAQGRACEAVELLAAQLQRAETGGRTGRVIGILALLAIALQASGKQGQGVAAMTRALRLGQAEGYARTFLDLGAPLGDLLLQVTARDVPVDYTAILLDAWRAEHGATAGPPATTSAAQPLLEPLTERETEVLRLLALGLSNKEIAERLVVASSTVKQHLKSIYPKLDVHSRTEAVVRGQELGLL